MLLTFKEFTSIPPINFLRLQLSSQVVDEWTRTVMTEISFVGATITKSQPLCVVCSQKLHWRNGTLVSPLASSLIELRFMWRRIQVNVTPPLYVLEKLTYLSNHPANTCVTRTDKDNWNTIIGSSTFTSSKTVLQVSLFLSPSTFSISLVLQETFLLKTIMSRQELTLKINTETI